MAVININLESKQSALDNYLPFVKQGGVTTYLEESLEFASEVSLTVKLPELKQELSCKSRVVWIGADDFQGKKKYGLQLLGDEGFEINQIIENYLVGLLKHDD